LADGRTAWRGKVKHAISGEELVTFLMAMLSRLSDIEDATEV
jgi:hypothetical protein